MRHVHTTWPEESICISNDSSVHGVIINHQLQSCGIVITVTIVCHCADFERLYEMKSSAVYLAEVSSSHQPKE